MDRDTNKQIQCDLPCGGGVSGVRRGGGGGGGQFRLWCQSHVVAVPLRASGGGSGGRSFRAEVDVSVVTLTIG